ncbi:MAG: SDR family oxidoreductase [Pseudomonadota bacterium]
MKSYLAIFSVLLLCLSSSGHSDEHHGKRAVLVTGASSGIGKEIALTLADQGFFVYAGARKPDDIKALSELPNTLGIRLDVTVQSDIDNAVKIVKQRGLGLYGLVNNAGVFLFDPLIEVSEQDMQFMMDVNLFGPYRVTKAFAPLIIEQKGRITTIGSIAGIVSSRLMGPYSMSKHAVEAFSESLSLELKKFDVQVSVVEPGNFRSDIMKNMKRRSDAKKNAESQSLFSAEIGNFANFAKEDRSQHLKPTPVADAVLQFMTAKQTQLRYMVAPTASEAHFTIGKALGRVIELNEGHEFALTRDQLVKLLDAQLEQ